MRSVILLLLVIVSNWLHAQATYAGKYDVADYHVDILPDRVLYGTSGPGPNYSIDSLQVDINNDGVIDLTLKDYDGPGLGNLYHRTYLNTYNNCEIGTVLKKSCYTVDCDGYPHSASGDIVQGLDSAANIPDQLDWVSGEVSTSIYNCCFIGMTGSYIPVRLNIQNNTLYGWINLQGRTIKEYACTQIIVSTKDPVNESKLEILPNPATGNIRFRNLNNYPALVTIYDVHNRSVLTETIYDNTLNLGQLEPGLYTINIIVDDQYGNWFRIVKE